MSANKGTLRTCAKGHEYYKSSDCPVCPICEQENKPADGFFSKIGAPARRALEHKGIITLQQLSELTEEEVLELHGMGPSTLPKLNEALASEGLTFKS
ncbi:hypothetical protein SAMN05443144_10219 [Fodinibius roseus]|uniref:RNA polymerase, alpha chain C terminal domain n=1 Tax=Fodinibius roseus TaxID=1194090 RepID=A0A1M4UF92_9BACT|nr:hypothetical protein [Fodinibius roseus]SHE55429.1 hypothetical protein SAMN05443144_10219 [Fodinibius roseus]